MIGPLRDGSALNRCGAAWADCTSGFVQCLQIWPIRHFYDAHRVTATEVVGFVRTMESGPLQHEIYFNNAESECTPIERYRDSSGFIEHGANVGDISGGERLEASPCPVRLGLGAQWSTAARKARTPHGSIRAFRAGPVGVFPDSREGGGQLFLS
jgi:hypothetical protein